MRRIKNRNALLEKVRGCYLKDVVLLKRVIKDVLEESERKAVFKTYDDAVPSLDLSEAMALRAPPNSWFSNHPCESCGRAPEILVKDSEHVERLDSKLQEAKDRFKAFRSEVAELQEKVRNAMIAEHLESLCRRCHDARHGK